MILNRNQTRRDELLKPFFEAYEKDLAERLRIYRDGYVGGLRYFQGLTPQVLEQLVAERFADPDQYQNDSPSTGGLLLFAQSFPEMGITFEGHVTNLERGDYRVTVEGLSYTNADKATPRFLEAWGSLAETASETHDRRLWWD